MKHLLTQFLLTCLFLTGVPARALPPTGNTLRGRISDSTGQPLPGAIIQLPDLHAGTVSATDGSYEIGNLPGGSFLVSVKLLGYAAQTRRVSLSGETVADFTLTAAVLEQSEVIITGTSHATELRRSTTPIQSVSMQQLQEHPSTNVIDAISRMPGISQVSTGPAVSKPVIRGLGYNRIVTLNDGIRQEGQQWGDEHGIEIDDYNVSRIEVLKGPAPLAYGSDALAGVINIISNEPLPQGKIGGIVSANYQTNNGLAALHARLAGNNKGIIWNGYLTGKKAHDYRNRYDGYAFNTRFANLDYGFGLGINRQWGASRLSFTSFRQDLGIAEGERDSVTGLFIRPVDDNGVVSSRVVRDDEGVSYDQALPRQHILHRKLSWVNSLYLKNGGRLGLTIGLQQNTRQEFDDVLQPGTPGLYLQLQTGSYEVRYLFPGRKGWQWSAGVNGMLQHNENRGLEFLVPDYRLFDGGGYVMMKKENGPWTIAGGLRLDTRSLHAQSLYVDSDGLRLPAPEPGRAGRFNAFTRRFTSPSGSIGISYALNAKTTFRMNVASGYRAPNIAELGANGVHEGTLRYEYGNTALQAENSLQGDLGIEWHSDHVHVNAALFYNYISHFIFIRKLTAADGRDSVPVVNNEEGFSAFAFRQTDARLMGGEVYFDLHPHPLDWLHFEHTVSYVTGRSAEGGDSTRYLPGIPPARWLAALRAQRQELGKYLRHAYIRLELDNYAAQRQVFSAWGTETPSAAFSLLNASIGFDLVYRTRTMLTVTLAADNLTDAAYQQHLSRLRYAPVNYDSGRRGIWGMGRNFSLLLQVPLEFR